MSVKGGPLPSVTFECRDTGADLVAPNIALLAWLQTQAGKEIGELDPDEIGSRPWDEISQIVAPLRRPLAFHHLNVSRRAPRLKRRSRCALSAHRCR